MSSQLDKGKCIVVDQLPPSPKSSSNSEGTSSRSITSEAWEHFIQLSSYPLRLRSKSRYCGKEYKVDSYKREKYKISWPSPSGQKLVLPTSEKWRAM